jgi:hypothetical protein
VSKPEPDWDDMGSTATARAVSWIVAAGLVALGASWPVFVGLAVVYLAAGVFCAWKATE